MSAVEETFCRASVKHTALITTRIYVVVEVEKMALDVGVSVRPMISKGQERCLNEPWLVFARG